MATFTANANPWVKLDRAIASPPQLGGKAEVGPSPRSAEARLEALRHSSSRVPAPLTARPAPLCAQGLLLSPFMTQRTDTSASGCNATWRLQLA